MAKWIRHRPSKPRIGGSNPSCRARFWSNYVRIKEVCDELEKVDGSEGVMLYFNLFGKYLKFTWNGDKPKWMLEG